MNKPTYEIINADCLETLKTLEDNSIDAIVTDPPYGLGTPPPLADVLKAWINGEKYEVSGRGFMGKEWDAFVPDPLVWKECFRVLKPGGHILAFAGTRTQHLMATALELAGFEIRDMLAWVYGSGFPKSLDISKAIDKAAGAEREAIGDHPKPARNKGNTFHLGQTAKISLPATPEAKQWEGWGTALKTALEPITLARKPFKGTVASNVLTHGTGGLNIDGCRIATNDNTKKRQTGKHNSTSYSITSGQPVETGGHEKGRFPTNLIHDGSEEVEKIFPQTGAAKKSSRGKVEIFKKENSWIGESTERGHNDNGGSASRYFYCAKASKKDRSEGVENNTHPTVKPTDLMRWLCRLLCPPNGIILDPFTGSGSTGKAAVLEGFNFIGCELSEEYVNIATARIEYALKHPEKVGVATPKIKEAPNQNTLF